MTITGKQAAEALALTGYNTSIEKRYGIGLTPQEQFVVRVALDEAGLIEKLPEVEPFVAEWFEAHKDDLGFHIECFITDLCNNNSWARKSDDFEDWFNNGVNNAIETLFKMKQGYTIKEEKKFILLYKKNCAM